MAKSFSIVRPRNKVTNELSISTQINVYEFDALLVTVGFPTKISYNDSNREEMINIIEKTIEEHYFWKEKEMVGKHRLTDEEKQKLNTVIGSFNFSNCI
jgi:hypothetical protein